MYKNFRDLPVGDIRAKVCKGQKEQVKELAEYSLSFSSEEPYNRFYGTEILDHSDGAVDLSRLKDIGVVLYNHDRDKVIGKITEVSIVNARGTATINFDDDDFSEKIRQKVESGTLKGVSVGYVVNEWEEVEKNKKSSDGRFNGPCSIAKKWMPYEISIVSIPADASVGVGRDFENDISTGASVKLAERQVIINKNFLERSKKL